MKNIIFENFKSVLFTIIGCAILAFSINYFFLGNKLGEGGMAGIALIIHYLFHLDVSLVYFSLNIPLIIIGYKIIGRNFIFKTLFATTVLSGFLKIFENFRGPMDDILVASIFGGALSGIGMGLLFISGGSSGGTDIIAKIINKYTGITIGKIILFLDFLILSVIAFLFGKNVFMYTLIALAVSSKLIDIIQEGISSAKSVTIITSEPDEIKERIMDEVGRGVTILSGRGGYTNNHMDIIHCIIGKYQLIKVKTIVKEVDPKAFMTVNHVNEVIGNGFAKE